jgi:hypothetical protein
LRTAEAIVKSLPFELVLGEPEIASSGTDCGASRVGHLTAAKPK